MANYPYLLKRGHTYYFRMAVPLPIVKELGKSELVTSLKTKEKMEALKRSFSLVKLAQETFELVNQLDRTQALTHFRNRKAGIYLSFKPAVEPLLVDDNAQATKFSEIVLSYLKETEGNNPKGWQRKKMAYDLWVEKVGNTVFKDITKQHARKFKDVLLILPRHRKKCLKDMKTLAPNTVNIRLSALSSLFTWAINNGYYNEQNPFTGLKVKELSRTNDKRLPFSPDQLKQIDSMPTPTHTTCRMIGNTMHCNTM